MWSLKVVRGGELADKLVPQMRLPQPLQSFTIGRDPANQWPIVDRARAISARHCEIIDSPHGPALRDLSTNGTFVNGAKQRLDGEHLLRNGDRIELGPFIIEVSGPPMPARPAAPFVPPSHAAPPRTPGVLDTAQQRGGDPAAMLAMGGGAPSEGLTEMLRFAVRPQDSGVEMTKIRPASAADAPSPKAAVPAPPKLTDKPASQSAPSVLPSAAAAAAAQSVPPSVSPSAPVSPALVSASALTEALARGLGLPVAALAAQDPLLLAQRLASSAQAALSALRQLMEHQAQARRSIGSRLSVMTPLRDANPLRVAASAQAATLALATAQADPALILQRSAAELCAHQDQLLQAFRSAMQRLGAQIAPDALQAALQAGGDAATPQDEHARLWELYTALWNGMGLAPGQDWSAGFQEVALHHLATAYDDLPR